MSTTQIWCDEKAHVVKLLCDNLIEAGSFMCKKDTLGKSSSSAIPQYKRAAVATMKLKHFNREIHHALEKKRKQVDEEKEVVEVLKLKLENVLYKKAYLQREIRVLKDFTTPELNAVEKEIGRPLAAVDYLSAVELSDIEISATFIMKEEIREREETSKKLENLVTISSSKEDVLDKKRKFLDDIPLRMASVRASTTDIQVQFDSYKNELDNVDNCNVEGDEIQNDDVGDEGVVEGSEDHIDAIQEGQEEGMAR